MKIPVNNMDNYIDLSNATKKESNIRKNKNMKIVEYKTIKSAEYVFDKLINEKINEGFVPYGPPIYCQNSHFFVQAMVKYEKDEDEFI